MPTLVPHKRHARAPKAFVIVLTAVLLISFGLSTGGNALGIGVLPIAILLVAGMLDALDQNDLS